MKAKTKNILIHSFTWVLFMAGVCVIGYFQYINNAQIPTWIKATIPCLLALLIFFLVYYKSLKAHINRKLTAVETAKELGKTGRTGSVIANLLESIGVIVPLGIMCAIFILGGEYLVSIGWIMLEFLGLYLLVLVGNIWCDANTREEIKKNEQKAAEALADSVARNIQTKKYD